MVWMRDLVMFLLAIFCRVQREIPVAFSTGIRSVDRLSFRRELTTYSWSGSVMLDRTLADFCSPRKQNNADRRFCHYYGVKAQPKSQLQRRFIRRLDEEMKARQISQATLASRTKGLDGDEEVGQTTISAILRGKHDPKLGTVSSICRALGLPAWSLMLEPDDVEQTVIRPSAAAQQKVVRLGGYPSVLPAEKPKTPLIPGRSAKKNK
jgi:transcriptional regulator with XRE-family HTH domain